MCCCFYPLNNNLFVVGTAAQKANLKVFNISTGKTLFKLNMPGTSYSSFPHSHTFDSSSFFFFWLSTSSQTFLLSDFFLSAYPTALVFDTQNSVLFVGDSKGRVSTFLFTSMTGSLTGLKTFSTPLGLAVTSLDWKQFYVNQQSQFELIVSCKDNTVRLFRSVYYYHFFFLLILS